MAKRLTAFVSMAAAFVAVMLSSTGTASASTAHPIARAETAVLSPDNAKANASECQGGAESGWFCLYSGPGFTGDAIGVDTCVNVVIPWTGAGSFDDEMVGTRGWVYFVDGSSWPLPPPPTSGNVDWAPVASVRTC